MIYLFILKADGSLYWKESFNDRADADKWLEEEQTRLYWDKEFKVSLLDSSTALDSEVDILDGEIKINEDKKAARILKESEESEKIRLKEIEKKAQRTAIRAVKNATNVEQLKAAIIELIKYLEIGDQEGR